MKKRIGYIFCNRGLGKDEKAFLKVARKKNIDLIMFNVYDDIEEEDIEQKAKKCDIIFNNSAEEFAIELVKTLEEMGRRVIDSSETYYHTEDKWMFYLKCKEHGIPTPRTELLSENLNMVKKELLKFNEWPVIIKRIEGTCGDYVEKADNVKQAVRIIKMFWRKGGRNVPVIAQEMIKSPSYRITLVDGKVVQTAIKKSKGSWKATGVHGKKFGRFKIDKSLRVLVNKISRVMKIKVCGIDLLKKGQMWFVLEVNSSPGLDFFEDEREKLVGKVLDYLKKA